MKKTAVLLVSFFLLVLLGTDPASAAVSVVQLGDEVLTVYDGRPLNVVNISNKSLYLPSFADEEAVKEYL